MAGGRVRRRRQRVVSAPTLGGPLLVLLTLVAIVQVIPFIYMFATAFKPLDELFIFPPRFWVQRPTLNNFRDLLTATSSSVVPFSRYIFNTVFLTVVTVFLAVFCSSLAAYPLSMHNVPGKGIIFTGVVLAMTFAPAVTQIPRYLIMSRLGMIDTYWALIVPTLANTYGVFLMKQFLDSVPREILEAAKIDGATEWDMYWKVVMPVTQPAWATLAIFSFQGAWGDASSPLVYTRTEAMKTLPLALQTIASGGVARAGAMAAASMIAALPGVIVFATMQRRVIETMVHSGIKS